MRIYSFDISFRSPVAPPFTCRTLRSSRKQKENPSSHPYTHPKAISNERTPVVAHLHRIFSLHFSMTYSIIPHHSSSSSSSKGPNSPHPTHLLRKNNSPISGTQTRTQPKKSSSIQELKTEVGIPQNHTHTQTPSHAKKVHQHASEQPPPVQVSPPTPNPPFRITIPSLYKNIQKKNRPAHGISSTKRLICLYER